MDAILQRLLNPQKLWTRAEILAKPAPVPKARGFYAWYFYEVPAQIPVINCVVRDGAVLLYIGIAPESADSKQNLRTRLRCHMKGNAEGSTLRRSLGCLLTEQLGIELRRAGASGRTTFGPGEAFLDAWLAQYARVTWHASPEPWVHERQVVRAVSLPLNLEHNSDHPFRAVLSDLRSRAKNRVKAVPIWSA